MIAVFDATVLVYLLDADAKAPLDPSRGAPIECCADRVNHLLSELQEMKARIVIPTPSLAEVLVKAADAAGEWLAQLNRSRHFHVVPFDARAAVEYAAMESERLRVAGRRTAATRAKAKFDAQIVAIAAIERATVIYSDDADIATLSAGRFDVKGVLSLPLPPQPPQLGLPFKDQGR